MRTGKAGDAITSGIEVIWSTTPTKWSNDFFKHLFSYEWELTKSPAGANQWTPKNGAGAGTVPDPYDKSKRRSPSMLTTDLSLRFDPAYEKISRRFYEHPDQFADAFARAWYKLTHRDMGPVSRYLGPLVPKEPQLFQDPVPAVDHKLVEEQRHCRSEGRDPQIRIVYLPAGRDGLGVGGDVPRIRQARWSERGPDSPCAAKGLGSEPAGCIGESCCRHSKRSKRSSTLHSLAGRRSRSPT